MTRAFGTFGLKWKSKSSNVLSCSKFARRTRCSNCLPSRRSTSSERSRNRNSSYGKLSSLACCSRSSSDCKTPLSRNFLRCGTSSSMALIAALRVVKLRQVAREARSVRPRRLSLAGRERLEIECARQDVLHRLVAVAAIETCPAGRRRGALDWKLLEVRHDGLHGPQLQQDIVRVEDFAHEGSNFGTHAICSLFPVRTTAMPKLGSSLGQ